MTERAARLVEHIFRVAQPGDELFAKTTRGPETEDTTRWHLTAQGDVVVSSEVVYPGMALVDGGERTLSLEEAKHQVLAALLRADTDGRLVPWYERKWRMEWRFRLVNVFCVDGDRLSGNPLCVFEDARGLSDVDMQRLARQMNLSETTFLLPAQSGAHKRVRIFTPTFEMPFAGHPTLGSAHVVRSLDACGDAVKLEMKVGIVDVHARGDSWTFTAAQPPQTRSAAPRTELARMLGLDDSAIVDEPLWVDTGAEQLIIPLRSVDDVARARPDSSLLARHGFSEKRGAAMAYVWARAGDSSSRVTARFFFLVHGAVVEDPATGSACANLGGWHVATKQRLPVALDVSQGAQIGRPSQLRLRVDAEGAISVGGSVVELARGAMSL